MKHLIPIDFDDVRRQTLIRDGKLCFSARFGGWGMLTDYGFFADYKPPFDVGNRYKGGVVVRLRIIRGLFWEITTRETEIHPKFAVIKFC